MDSKEKDDVEKDSYSDSHNKNFLPEDVIFDVLTRLPTEWLYNSARITCKSWAAMICRSDFVKAHLLRAKAGIFVQSKRHPYGAHFLEVKGNGEYGVTALSHRFPGRYLNCCDGLVLFYQKATGDLRVVNPATMQTLNVPKLLSSTLNFPQASIVRVPRTGEYKLFASVKTQCEEVHYCHWHVLRLGKDITCWTRFASEAGDFKFRCTPIYCGGNDLYWITKDHVIVMDVDKETFRQFSLPLEQFTQFFKIENRLAYIADLSAEGYKILVFEADTGKWRFHHQIHHQLGVFCDYYYCPTDYDDDEVSYYSESFRVWINQELIFEVTLGCPVKASLYSYNVQTSELKKIDVIPEGSFNCAFEGSFEMGVDLHTNSLLSW